MNAEDKLAALLNKHGIKATASAAEDECVDAEVKIAGTCFYVQVGEDYLILAESAPESAPNFWVRHIKETTMANVVTDLRSLLSKRV